MCVDTDYGFYSPYALEGCGDWLRIARAPRSESLCEENLANLQYFLSNCMVNDESCRDGIDIDFLPTRLIDLDQSEDGNMLYLVETRPEPVAAMYSWMALSYCWGQDSVNQFRTTKENYSNHLAGFSLQSVSKVIQDAVVVARALRIKVRYLWVDAVCIVQDDREDWIRESRIMGDVYEGAYITLGAMASHSSNRGFLERRIPRSITMPFRSTIKPDIKGSFRLHAVDIEPYCLRDASALGNYGLDKALSSWNKRAWTLQERFLARRLLLFGKRAITFSCKRTCQIEPFLVPTLRTETSFLTKPHDPKSNPGWYSLWNSWIAEELSSRDLAFESDLFPCISGLAERASRSGTDKYVAGIWGSNLKMGLLWACKTSKGPTRATQEEHLAKLNNPSTYVAPSWSWASHKNVEFSEFFAIVDSRHQFVDNRDEAEMEAWTTLLTSNPYGEISDAGLEYCGPFVVLSVRLGFTFQDDNGGSSSTKILNRLGTYSAIIRFDWENTGTAQAVDGLGLAPIVSHAVHCHSSKEENKCDHDPAERVAFGLVLYESTAKPGAFYRVGAFTGSWDTFIKVERQSIRII